MTKDFSIKPYAKTQVGAFVTPTKTSSLKDPFTILPYANEAMGVKAEKGNFFANAEAGAGTSATAKAALGYEVPIGKHFGLELSADGSYAQSLIGKDIKIINHVEGQQNVTFDNMYYHIDGPRPFNENNECSVVKYKESCMGAGVNLMAKYHPNDKLTFGAGVRASVVSANAKNTVAVQNIEPFDSSTFLPAVNPAESTDVHYTGISNITNTYKIGERHTQTVVSPVAEVKVKSGHWEVGTVLGFDGGQTGIAYNF